MTKLHVFQKQLFVLTTNAHAWIQLILITKVKLNLFFIQKVPHLLALHPLIAKMLKHHVFQEQLFVKMENARALIDAHVATLPPN